MNPRPILLLIFDRYNFCLAPLINKFKKKISSVEYFLTQRIKLKDDSKESKDLYHAQLTALHKILLDAMKCKQTINTNNTTSLLNNLNNFVNLYFDDHGKKHLRELN